MKKYMVFTIFLGLVFMPYKVAFAYVKGVCSKCHAMHFSQSPWPMGWQAEGPNNYLLIKATHGTHCSPCVSCHSSQTSSTYEDLGGEGSCKVPIVFYFGADAPNEYLAGGNFWWVSQDHGKDDTKGHNVFEGEDDDNLPGGAPGGSFSGCSNSCHVSLTHQTAIPGLGSGCQSCHVHVKHHAPDHENGVSGLVTSADQGWYRFLAAAHSPETSGVEGYEDGEWEAGLHDGANHQNASEHNEYLGTVVQGGYGFGSLGHTTTAFCTGCHGDFHMDQHQGDETATNPWIRHPSDAVIPDTAGSEYADTGGASHLYDPLSPVARPAPLSDPPTNPGKVNPGTDMVMCLSCHRPHGSPYPDLLRWDYTQQMIAGSDPGEGTLDQGCFYCHTTKDD